MFWRHLGMKSASVEWNVLWLAILRMPKVQHGYRDPIGEFCSAATLREACRVGDPRSALHDIGKHGRPLGAAKAPPHSHEFSPHHQIRRHCHSSVGERAEAIRSDQDAPVSAQQHDPFLGLGRLWDRGCICPRETTGRDGQDMTGRTEMEPNKMERNGMGRNGRDVRGATADAMGQEMAADGLSRMWALKGGNVANESPLIVSYNMVIQSVPTRDRQDQDRSCGDKT